MSCRDICLILKDPWSTSGHVAHTDLLQQARFGTGTDCALHVRDSVPIRDCALHARFGTDCVHRRASRRSQMSDLRSQMSDVRSQISDLRSQISDLRSQVDCTSHQSPAREARRSKIWSGKVNVMSCRDICLDVKKPNVMSCRDICLKKFNMRHRHLPRINKHLRKGQPLTKTH